jgi:hypothetical protein
MNEQHTDLPQPTHQPVFDDSLPPSPQPKSSKPLAVALVVSVVLLLAAAGVTAWLLLKPAGSTTLNQQAGDGSGSVKSVFFVAPASLPASYVKTDENTQIGQSTDYFDASTACRITTAVKQATDPDIKAVTIAGIEALKETGITTAATTNGSNYTFNDTDGSHKYAFSSVVADQEVSVPGVSFSHQKSIVAYKQFGSSHYASITFSCKDDSFESKKTELEALIQTFKVKTER